MVCVLVAVVVVPLLIVAVVVVVVVYLIPAEHRQRAVRDLGGMVASFRALLPWRTRR